MATLDTEQITSSGLNPTQNSAGASGDQVRPGVILRVINNNASTTVVALDTANPGSVDGNVVPDKEISIPTTEFQYIYVNDFYRDKSTGLATVTCTPNDDVLIEVVKS